MRRERRPFIKLGRSHTSRPKRVEGRPRGYLSGGGGYLDLEPIEGEVTWTLRLSGVKGFVGLKAIRDTGRLPGPRCHKCVGRIRTSSLSGDGEEDTWNWRQSGMERRIPGPGGNQWMKGRIPGP